MDTLMIHALLEANPDWEIELFEDDKGLFIGPASSLQDILENTKLTEEYL